MRTARATAPRWTRYRLDGGWLYVYTRDVAGERWCAKLIPTSPETSERACHRGWLLRIWRGAVLVDEQGADLPGTSLRRGKLAALVRLDQLGAGAPSFARAREPHAGSLSRQLDSERGVTTPINRHAVGLKGDRVIIVYPPRSLDPTEALELAAHLIVIASVVEGPPSDAMLERVAELVTKIEAAS